MYVSKVIYVQLLCCAQASSQNEKLGRNFHIQHTHKHNKHISIFQAKPSESKL